MGFKKPFRAVPVKLGERYLELEARQQRRAAIRLGIVAVVVAIVVFVAGMLITRSG